MPILYRVMLQRRGHEAAWIATVEAVETSNFRVYRLIDGKHLEPDMSAIRRALPHFLREAFDRCANAFWLPVGYLGAITSRPDMKNACSVTLYDSKGSRSLATIFAIPYRLEP